MKSKISKEDEINKRLEKKIKSLMGDPSFLDSEIVCPDDSKMMEKQEN